MRNHIASAIKRQGVFYAYVNGSPVIRTYEEESDGVYLLAENPEHPARKVRMAEGDKVIGRVIYVGRPE